MDDETLEFINGLYEYIEKDVFHYGKILMRNLRVMKFNTDLSWFNCAAIAKQTKADSGNAAGSVVVNTLYGWQWLFGTDVKLIKESYGSVTLLKPVIDFRNNMLFFERIPTYYKGMLLISGSYEWERNSALSVIVNSYGKEYETYLKILKKDWLDTYIDRYMRLFDFYYDSSDTKRQFLKNCLLLTFGEELKYEKDVVPGLIELEKEEAVVLYKNLHELIDSFHLSFRAYMDDVKKTYQRVLIAYPDLINIRSEVYEHLVRLMKGKGDEGNVADTGNAMSGS